MDDSIVLKVSENHDAEGEIDVFLFKYLYHLIQLSTDSTDIIYHTATNVKQKNDVDVDRFAVAIRDAFGDAF